MIYKHTSSLMFLWLIVVLITYAMYEGSNRDSVVFLVLVILSIYFLKSLLEFFFEYLELTESAIVYKKGILFTSKKTVLYKQVNTVEQLKRVGGDIIEISVSNVAKPLVLTYFDKSNEIVQTILDKTASTK